MKRGRASLSNTVFPNLFFYQAPSPFHALLLCNLKGVLYHEIFTLKTSIAYNSIQQTPLRNCILRNKSVNSLFLCMERRIYLMIAFPSLHCCYKMYTLIGEILARLILAF